MTTQNAAVASMYGELTTNFSLVPFVFENEDDNGPVPAPQKGAPWVRLVVRHQTSKQDTLGRKGKRKWQRRGMILIQVFTPSNEGRSESDAIVESLRGIYEGVTFSGVTCDNFIPRESGVVDDEYMVVVDVPFAYYQTR